jgi:hypothetical protein
MPWDCSDWEAIHDRMPKSEPTLRVTGECMMPTPGYDCGLRVREPQGINPRDLLLELIVVEPNDTRPAVITPCTINFELKTSAEYDTVSIIDVEPSIPVQEVS